MAKTFNFRLVGADDQYEAKARIYITGISNSGKSTSAILLAQGFGEKTAVIDTEKLSAAKYLGYFKQQGFEYTVLPLGDPDSRTGKRDYSPEAYIAAIQFLEQQGFKTCIIDSLSHAWFGEGGELDMVNDQASKSKSQNTYYAWRDVTPWHNKLIDAMLQSDMHIIATMRVKTEYVNDIVNGKQVPRKVGMAPIMRDGLEYEFDLGFDLDSDHTAVVTKTRCRELDGQIFRPITPGVSLIIKDWLSGKPNPKNEALPEEDVEYVRELAKKLGSDVETLVEQSLKSRLVPGTNDILTAESLRNNLIVRLEAKVAEVTKVTDEQSKTE